MFQVMFALQCRGAGCVEQKRAAKKEGIKVEKVLTRGLQREMEKVLGLDELSVWSIFVEYTKDRLEGRDGTRALRRHFVNEEPFEAELRDRVEVEFMLFSNRNGLRVGRE